MINRFPLFLIFASFFSVSISYSQELNTIHFTSNDGLPSSTVYRVLQDKKGFIWFATELGVSRYDGKKFTNYSSKDGLLDNTILEMYEDSKGRIWFLGLSGRVAYISNNKIYSGQNDTLLAKVHAKAWLTSIIEDLNGNIWIGSKSGQLFKFSGSQIENISATGDVISLGLFDGHIVYYSNKGKLYFISDGNISVEIKDQSLFDNRKYSDIYKVNFNGNRINFSVMNKIVTAEFSADKVELIQEKITGPANIQFLGTRNGFILAGTLR